MVLIYMDGLIFTGGDLDEVTTVKKAFQLGFRLRN